MIKAVIDTNVFVSGFLGKGLPHKILAAWSAAKFKLVVSSESVRLYADYAEPAGLSRPVCRDPNDEIFIGTALAGGADYIVSGGKDLLVLNPRMNIEVLTLVFL